MRTQCEIETTEIDLYMEFFMFVIICFYELLQILEVVLAEYWSTVFMFIL